MKTRTFLTLPFLGLAGRSLMTRKIFAWGLLCSFFVSSWSCVAYRWEQKSLLSIKPGKREGLKICAVQKKTGEKVEFSKETPARIMGDSVVEEKLIKIAIEKSNIAHPKFMNALAPPFDLLTKDGRSYRIAEWIELQNKIVVRAMALFSVMPLSDVDLVTIRKANTAETVLFGLMLPLAIIFILGSNISFMEWGDPAY